ncbi:MAG: CPBP family intramembrane metalloprotease [Clostridia bacterium]|nr:CPBP family intramembrane metalloprotease [Clostridia bacterium]
MNGNEHTMNYADQTGSHNYYQNLYNMFGGQNPLLDKHFTSLRRLGFSAGFVMLMCILMQNVVAVFIRFTQLSSLYASDTFYFHAISAVAQFFYTFLPFFVLFVFSKPRERKQMNIFEMPKSKELFILAVFAGLMFCMLGNTATSVLAAVISVFGIEFGSGMEDLAVPSGFMGILIYVINFAVLPALFEEFAFRCVILQPLRKYGDWFAILATSFCFAILHGNMVQIPFAFIVGIALGYFCIKTKSIWTSVTIHFLNNLFSVITTICYNEKPESSTFFYYVVTSAIVFAGAIAMVLFKLNCNVKLKKDATVMAKNKVLKRAAFVTSPALIFSIYNAIYTSLSLTRVQSAPGVLMLFGACVFASYLLIKWILTIRKDSRLKPRKTNTAALIITGVLTAVTVFTLFGISG